MKKLALIAVAALVGLVACGEENTGSSSAPTPKATTATAPAEAPKKVVWPPVPDTAVAIAPNLTQTNIMVVYDGSGSMGDKACGANGNRHESAVPAVKRFVEAVPTDTNLGLFVFDNRGVKLRVPLTANNKDGFNSALDAIRIGDGTPLKTAITRAYYVLEKKAQSQLGYGRYIMLVVTDGEANTGEDPTRVVNFLVDSTPVEVHTVGLCFTRKHSLNQEGRTFYTSAQNPDQLVEGLKSALAEASEDDVTFSN